MHGIAAFAGMTVCAGKARGGYTKGRGAGYPVIVPKRAISFSTDTITYGLDGRFDLWFLNLKDLS
jgi:hypothetical protein